MQTVDREAFDDVMSQLCCTVGIDGDKHECLQGINTTLPVTRAEFKDADEEEFLRLVKFRYVQNLRTIMMNVSGELAQICSVGHSKGLLDMAKLIANSFEEDVDGQTEDRS